MTLDLKKFSQIHEFFEEDYCYGFLVAAACGGFIEYEFENTRIFNIDINDSVGEQASTRFREQVNSAYSDDEELRDELFAVVDDAIDNLIMDD